MTRSNLARIGVVLSFALLMQGCNKQESNDVAPNSLDTSSTDNSVDQNSSSTTESVSTEIKVIVQGAPQIVSISDAHAAVDSFSGTFTMGSPSEIDTPSEPLFRDFGAYSYTAFEKHPEIYNAIHRIVPDFVSSSMDTSFLSSIATNGTTTLLLLSGCTPGDCGSTVKVIAYDPTLKVAWMVSEQLEDELKDGQYILYGTPDEFTKGALFKAILSY